MLKRISIIVPVYYGEKYVPGLIRQAERCRERLDRQTEIELLLINDAPAAPLKPSWGSQRLSVAVMNTDRNVGIHGARVKGLRSCSGDYVVFLDQDDTISPEYCLSQLSVMGNADAAVCRAVEAGKPYYSETNRFERIRSKEFWLANPNPIISPGQVLLKKQSIPRIWIENTLQYNGADDWFLWLCMLAEGHSFALNQEILYEHVWSETSASGNTAGMLRSEQEVIRIVREKRLFSDREFGMLLESFFTKNADRVQGLAVFQRKARILDQWMQLREACVSFSGNLDRAGIRTIAIYGCGMLGEHVYMELKDAMQVCYFIDRKAQELHKEIPVYPLSGTLPKVDAVILTLILEKEAVKKELMKSMDSKIIVLEDWIRELLRETEWKQ